MSKPNTGPAKARLRVSVIALFCLLFFGLAMLLVFPASAKSAVTPPLPPGKDSPTAPTGLCWQVFSSPNPVTPNGSFNSVAALSANDVWAVGQHDYQTLIERWNGTQWNVVPSPNPVAYDNYLYGVAAFSPDDAWAVGYYYVDGGYHTLVERWNGTAWEVVSSPSPGTLSNYLNAVVAVSPTDVWAVGYYIDDDYTYHTLVERWNGAAWEVVSSPSPGTGYITLNGVAAVSPTDVWAVGYYYEDGIYHTLVERLNGTAWEVVSSPNPGSYQNYLWAVTAVSPTDVWAVGSYIGGGASETLVERWNGTEWTVVPSLNQGTGDNYLQGVASVSPTDVWAVGVDWNSGIGIYQTLVERWNGTEWTIVPSPNQGTGSSYLYGVAALPSGAVWAAGDYHNVASPHNTLVERWNGTEWTIVPSPSPGSSSGSLNAVAAVSPNDVWAVGSYSNGVRSLTLIERWNGTEWSIVPSPNQGTYDNLLFGVAVASPTDIWAVGYYYEGGEVGAYRTLVERWNGTAWEVVPSPSPAGAQLSDLAAVAVVSATDVWAVGVSSGSSGPMQTLIERWNGTEWSIVSSPNAGSGDNRLRGVLALSANNVWAVGFGTNEALIERWDGIEWSIVPSPSPTGSLGSYLEAVAGGSPTDVWAAGDYIGEDGIECTLIEHWNGSEWSVTPSPCVPYAFLSGLTVISPTDAWAVGSTGYYPFHTVVQHWNGTEWSLVDHPTSGVSNLFSGVVGVYANDVWAVGSYQDVSANAELTLIERYSDSCISSTATPTTTPTTTPIVAPTHTTTASPTNTTTSTPAHTSTATATNPPIITATATNTATGTPTTTAPTPTSCTIQYPDVPPGSAFYPYVHCVACRGIVSGYPDGTFGPSNPVTRGQLSKIVSNSAGYTETFSSNTFEDVPVGSTFFPFVERLYLHGGIGGYACGNPEPCVPPANKPYFRPGANVTRGQTSKIVAIARGLPAPNPGQQTFEDVAPNSTFWQWIEPLAGTGAIGGYPCGGVEEPCNPPTNRPYFRPNANVTRGQSAKIVANTFFPNCSSPAVGK